MDTYFEDLEKELGLVEEKLDILSEWHLSKKHHGATEIAEDCRTAISQLWIQFYKLSEVYNSKRQVMRISLIAMSRICLGN